MQVRTITGAELGIQAWAGQGEPDPGKLWQPTPADSPESKPHLGFFSCDWDSECPSTRWLDYMRDIYVREQGHRVRSGTGRCLWTLVPNPEATLYVIDSPDAYRQLANEYPKGRGLTVDPNNPCCAPDWYKIAQSCDGVHATEGAVRAGIDEPVMRHLNFTGWCFESTLWFNWQFIKQDHIGAVSDDWTLIPLQQSQC